MTPLRQRMTEDMKLKRMPYNTQRSYLRQVTDFANHFGRSPEKLGREEIRSYLLHIVNERKVADGTYRQCLSAIRFLYRTTLSKDWLVRGIECVQRIKSQKSLPVILSLNEVRRFFEAIVSLKYRAICLLW